MADVHSGDGGHEIIGAAVLLRNDGSRCSTTVPMMPLRPPVRMKGNARPPVALRRRNRSGTGRDG